MVQLYSLSIFYKGSDEVATLITAAYHLESFPYFRRQPAEEFLGFAGKTVVEHTQLACRRQSVKENEYVCHVLLRADKLGAVLIADKEYPQLVAHTLITKILDDFTAQVPVDLWSSATDLSQHFTTLDEYLTKYQNPREADRLCKIQAELDETKIIMQKSIDAVLQRGVKLADLIEKTQDLSEDTREFYRASKEVNSCCGLGCCKCFCSYCVLM